MGFWDVLNFRYFIPLSDEVLGIVSSFGVWNKKVPLPAFQDRLGTFSEEKPLKGPRLD